MTKRTKKLLSLLLATTMVFSLNTTVFAEEVAVDSVEDAVEATVDEVAEEATVDATTDDDSSVAADTDVYEAEGIKYTVKDGKATAVTNIDYASNGEKKNEKFNVATIKNTTDPVSWNNAYGEDLIATVLYGEKGSDEWLNNSSKVTVSSNNPNVSALSYLNLEVENLASNVNDQKFQVIPVVEGSQYVFVGYGLADWNGYNFNHETAWVAGQDDPVEASYGTTWMNATPVIEWDGRQIDFNKSGDHKFTTGKKEALDVAVAFVTYANGTVTEIDDVEVGSVKVDKKNQKAASVELDVNVNSKTVKNYALKEGSTTEYELKDQSVKFFEHKTMGDLPFFTIKVKVGKNGKDYKKAITDKINKDKDLKFYFGIMQHEVNVTTDGKALDDVIPVYASKDTVSSNNGLSANDIKLTEEAIAEAMTAGVYADMDTDKAVVDDFEVTKFTDKGATVTLQGYVGEKKTYNKENLKALSGKGKNADYSLESGSVANTDVKYLQFVDNGNFVYRPLDLDWTDGTTFGYNFDEKAEATRVFSNGGDLAPAGFKWAFRKSPVEKSKDFRYGIYKTTNQGFVYSVDEAAVDSVEEVF